MSSYIIDQYRKITIWKTRMTILQIERLWTFIKNVDPGGQRGQTPHHSHKDERKVPAHCRSQSNKCAYMIMTFWELNVHEWCIMNVRSLSEAFSCCWVLQCWVSYWTLWSCSCCKPFVKLSPHWAWEQHTPVSRRWVLFLWGSINFLTFQICYDSCPEEHLWALFHHTCWNDDSLITFAIKQYLQS